MIESEIASLLADLSKGSELELGLVDGALLEQSFHYGYYYKPNWYSCDTLSFTCFASSPALPSIFSAGTAASPSNQCFCSYWELARRIAAEDHPIPLYLIWLWSGLPVCRKCPDVLSTCFRGFYGYPPLNLVADFAHCFSSFALGKFWDVCSFLRQGCSGDRCGTAAVFIFFWVPKWSFLRYSEPGYAFASAIAVPLQRCLWAQYQKWWCRLIRSRSNLHSTTWQLSAVLSFLLLAAVLINDTQILLYNASESTLDR